MLRDIEKAIRSVLRINTHMATETRGCFAKLCVQNFFDKTLDKNMKVGGLDHLVQYEGITTLCFLCGRVDHKVEGYPYKAGVPKKVDRPEEAGKDHILQGQGLLEEETFRPWILVAQKKKQSRKIQKESNQLPLLEPAKYGPKKLMYTGPSNMALSMVNVGLGNSTGKQKQKASGFSFGSDSEADHTKDLSLLNKTKVISSNVKDICSTRGQKPRKASQDQTNKKPSQAWRATSQSTPRTSSEMGS